MILSKIYPEFEYQNFSAQDRKYDERSDRIVLRPTMNDDTPPPSFAVTYKSFPYNKLKFTIMGNPHYPNPIRVIWEVSTGGVFLSGGDEDARVSTKDIVAEIPHFKKGRDSREIKLTICLKQSKPESVSDRNHCGVIISGFKALNYVNAFWFEMDNYENTEPATPPHELMEFGESSQQHLETGKYSFSKMTDSLEHNGIYLTDMKCILEFGCSNCRILRHFADFSDSLSIWGTDIQANKILWAMENIPEINLIVNNASPPLPFESRMFDFTYAGSVFTHLVEYHTAWIAELARVTKPGGYVYLTFADEIAAKHIYNALTGKPTVTFPDGFEWGFSYANFFLQNEELFEKLAGFDFDFLCGGWYAHDNTQAHVFMSRRYIMKITKTFFELVDIVPAAYFDWQTAYIFKRKEQL